jgi:hypothetical protein
MYRRQGGAGVKTNGIVIHQTGSLPAPPRWQARCLLCPWPQREGRLYASKKAANLGIERHLHIMHHLNSKDRQIDERKALGEAAKPKRPVVYDLGGI